MKREEGVNPRTAASHFVNLLAVLCPFGDCKFPLPGSKKPDADGPGRNLGVYPLPGQRFSALNAMIQLACQNR
jgi:hypothetical protein